MIIKACTHYNGLRGLAAPPEKYGQKYGKL